MKKIFILLLFCFVLCCKSFAEPLQAEINFTWDKITQTERDNDIEQVKYKVFTEDTIYNYSKNEFSLKYKPFIKNPTYKRDYHDVKSGLTETKEKIIVPFYFKKILFAYGVIYKTDLKHCYYYDALGKLIIIEILDKNYDNYPVVSYQYDKKGNLINAVYSQNSYDAYMYSPDKKFLGRWYKNNYYNAKGKIKMTRSLPEILK